MAVAGVYAESLYGAAGAGADALLDEMQDLGRLLASDPDLRDYLTSPLVDTQERAAAIEKVFRGRASDLLVNTLQVVNRKGRSALLPSIVEAYRRKVDQIAGRIDVSVKSAVPLTDALRADLEASIQKFSGKQPRLSESVDSSLLAGMVVQIGDRKFDTSASAALGRLEAALLERASRQILAGAGAFEE